MSDRDLDVDLTNGTEKNLSQIPTSEEVLQYKTRLAQVYERGLIVDRLHVDLPDHLHGEWVSRDVGEIARMELLGFQVDTEYATKRKLNDKADGSAIIGDVVFMIQPKWMKEVHDEKRRQMYFDTHLKKKQKEESDFITSQASIGEDQNTRVASQYENLPGHELSQRMLTKKE